MKNIYTTSATIRLLMYREKVTLHKLKNILGESLPIVKSLKEGKKDFSKEQYLKIITEFPYLEGHIENYENVKKDK